MTITRETITHLGALVLCDWCNEDWTSSDQSGGFIFGAKATCPNCAPGLEADAKRFNELDHIKARCPADMSFADWVREGRGPDAKVEVISATTFDELADAIFKGADK